MEKAEIRREIRQKRRNLDDSVRKTAAASAAASLLETEFFKKAKQVFAYSDFDGELETDPLLTAVLSSGKRLALPHVDDASKMSFYEVKDIRERRPGAFSIPEPEPTGDPVIPGVDTLILLPGLAFDKIGHRIGSGRGYYDTYLRKYPDALTLGYAYEFQIFPEIPADEWDVLVDGILTECGLKLCQGGETVAKKAFFRYNFE